ncbi:hypothetical protein WICPIJ_000885 [Wickerhamomyces pijperi]|uniref:Uncharacterized protein n=1 Tax=Wickerhamomyces pijperi TaxID=599730 RepID=A0A9P8TRC2_WICPI|nr:hypothetical protein WICPIJ_000885 [Wickerhamomyces pijperi]
MSEEKAIISDTNAITKQISDLDIRQETEISSIDTNIITPTATTDEPQYNNDRTLTNNSEVVVKKLSGKVKVRKGQPEEAYLIQKNLYQESGPQLNTLTWLEELDLSKLDANIKTDRTALESLTERLYYSRDYKKCLEVTEFALEFVKVVDNQKKIKNEIDELISLKERCEKRLQQASL